MYEAKRQQKGATSGCLIKFLATQFILSVKSLNLWCNIIAMALLFLTSATGLCIFFLVLTSLVSTHILVGIEDCSAMPKCWTIGPLLYRAQMVRLWQSSWAIGPLLPRERPETMFLHSYITLFQPITSPANIVSGANLRTKSNVWFGDPPQGDKFFSTTTDSTYKPNEITSGKYQRPNLTTKSDIPVKYYGNTCIVNSKAKDCPGVMVELNMKSRVPPGTPAAYTLPTYISVGSVCPDGKIELFLSFQ